MVEFASHTGHIRRSIRRFQIESCSNRVLGLDLNIGPQTENRLKKLMSIWRALHEYVNVVHDPEKQYRSLSAPQNAGVLGVCTYLFLAPPIS